MYTQRWLLLHGREEAALKSLTWIRNGAYDKLALQQEFEEMKLNAERELENKKTSSIFDLFRAKNIRRTLIAAGIGCANPASGAIFIMGFGTYFFKVVSIESDAQTIYLT
jgi:SP family sugar:H+ symporter-like MFS transporter